LLPRSLPWEHRGPMLTAEVVVMEVAVMEVAVMDLAVT
jgi:hypothetical protein